MKRLCGNPPRPPFGKTCWPDGTPAPEEQVKANKRKLAELASRRLLLREGCTTETPPPSGPSLFRPRLSFVTEPLVATWPASDAATMGVSPWLYRPHAAMRLGATVPAARASALALPAVAAAAAAML